MDTVTIEAGADIVRIWFQKHTIIGRNPWLDSAYDGHVRDVLAPATKVSFSGLPPEVYEGTLPADYVRFGQIETLFSWYFADRAVEAERQGYDAYVIGTSQDPGLEMARSMVSIPVVGYGETVFNYLQTQGVQFGIVGFIPELEEAIRSNLTRRGWAASCIGFEYLPAGRNLVEEALRAGDTGQILPVMEASAARLRERGADVIVPGEGLPNEVLWAAGIRTLAGLPFVDANGLALTTAEMLARTRHLGVWGFGTNSYRTKRAPIEEVDRLRRIFSPAISQDLATPVQADYGE